MCTIEGAGPQVLDGSCPFLNSLKPRRGEYKVFFAHNKFFLVKVFSLFPTLQPTSLPRLPTTLSRPVSTSQSYSVTFKVSSCSCTCKSGDSEAFPSTVALLSRTRTVHSGDQQLSAIRAPRCRCDWRRASTAQATAMTFCLDPQHDIDLVSPEMP
jgi:hypothetical protein